MQFDRVVSNHLHVEFFTLVAHKTDMSPPAVPPADEIPPAAVIEPALRLHTPVEAPADDATLSPSIARCDGEEMEAYELKFLVDETLAAKLQLWASVHMQPDPHANPRLNGAYLTTTLYLDTPDRDVLFRADGHRRRKYRLRRYGIHPLAFLERKTRGQDRVKKRRSVVPLHELSQRMGASVTRSPDVLSPVASPAAAEQSPWAGDWFCERIEQRRLQPACLISYERTAFLQPMDGAPLRLTLDRNIRGELAHTWDLTPLTQGHRILPAHVICEFKFRGALPTLFKQVILDWNIETRGVSKYRQMMFAAGAVPREDRRHA